MLYCAQQDKAQHNRVHISWDVLYMFLWMMQPNRYASHGIVWIIYRQIVTRTLRARGLIILLATLCRYYAAFVAVEIIRPDSPVRGDRHIEAWTYWIFFYIWHL